MQDTHYVVPTDHSDADESLRAGTVLKKSPSSRPSETIRNSRGQEAAPASYGRSIATVGCLLTMVLVLLGCCLLAGLAGLVVAGIVVVVIVSTVSRTIVQLRLCEAHKAGHASDGEVVSPARTSEVRPRWKEGQMPGKNESRPAFWDALSSEERHAFESTAEERIFAGGATLVAEGDKADHVILIRSGWTKICVNEHGRQRVIADEG